MRSKAIWGALFLSVAALGAVLPVWAAAPSTRGGQTSPATTTSRPTTTTSGPATTTSRPVTMPGPKAQHVVIISIDGCRPDVLLRANTPNLRRMMAQGSFTFYAETTDVAITLPSHTSMITGVKPEKHGIDFNDDPEEEVFPKVPTILTLAHDKGMKTGVFSTKSKFTLYTPPGVIDFSSISKESSSPDDIAIAVAAAEAIVKHKPAAMLVHFGNNDKTGHAKGWGTPEQLIAMEWADTAVGKVIDALQSAGIYNKTLVIVSADHGGSGTEHGKNDPRWRYIPWIAVGPGLKVNYDLTRDRRRTVKTEDTFATACFFIGLQLPPNTDGRPVFEALASRNQGEERLYMASQRVETKPGDTKPAEDD